jgi:hypothetical protein
MTELYTYNPSLWIRVLEYDRVVYLAHFFMDQSAGVWQSCILTTLLYGSVCWSMIELYTYHPSLWIRVLEYDIFVYLAPFYGSECRSMIELYIYHPYLWIRVKEYDRVVYLAPFFMDQRPGVWESCILSTLLYGSECCSMTELYTCHPSLWIRLLAYDSVVYFPPFFMDQSAGVW